MKQLLGKLSQKEPFCLRPWDWFKTYKREPGYFLGMHQHDYFQLLHVLEGELEVDYGEGWCVLREGDVHVLPVGYGHALRSTRGYMQFGANFKETPDERGLQAAILRVFAEPTVFHMRFRESWMSMLRPPIVLRPDVTCFKLLHTLDEYGIALLENREAGSDDADVRELLDYLNANLDRMVPVNEITRDLHRSRATLQRLCQRNFYCGLSHLHERLRLKHAANYLLEHDVSISTCARVWGYQDVYHFSRSFKRVFGLSPRAYRKHHQEEMTA